MLEYDPKRRLLPFNALQSSFFKRTYDETSNVNQSTVAAATTTTTTASNNHPNPTAMNTSVNLNSTSSPNLDPSKWLACSRKKKKAHEVNGRLDLQWKFIRSLLFIDQQPFKTPGRKPMTTTNPSVLNGHKWAADSFLLHHFSLSLSLTFFFSLEIKKRKQPLFHRDTKHCDRIYLHENQPLMLLRIIECIARFFNS